MLSNETIFPHLELYSTTTTKSLVTENDDAKQRQKISNVFKVFVVVILAYYGSIIRVCFRSL